MLLLRVLLVAAVGIVPLIAFGAAESESPAIDRFATITKQMHQARVAGDWKTFSTNAERLSTLLNGSPDAAIEMARGEARSGNNAGALARLRAVAAAGQSVPAIATLPDFAPLHETGEFKEILGQMRGNAEPRSNAHRFLTVDDPNLLPEDIDYDSATKTFLLSSVLKDEIVRVGAHGHTRAVARSPSGWPMLALKIDRARGVIWSTEDALDGFKAVPKRDWGRSALLAFDLRDGRLLRRFEPKGVTALGDLALLPDGGVIVSDGAQGGVYMATLRSASLKRIDSGQFISPQTPAYVSPGVVLVPDYVRGIALVNVRTGISRWLSMQSRYALEGIDGAYLVRRNLYVTQNGTSPERVAVFRVDPAVTQIESLRVIEQATPNFDPTHGVWAGNKFFYIANSGWNTIGDDGTPKSGIRRTGASIMEYDKQ